MSEKNSMCEFRELKQKPFDEACFSFARQENMEAIARELEMSPTMLRNKLNPDQPHVLKPVELIAISKVSGNYTLVNSLLLGLDVVTAPIESAEQAESIVGRLFKHNANAGELSAWALAHGNQNHFSRTQKSFGHPHPKKFFLIFHLDAESKVNGFVDDLLILAHLHNDAVQVNNGINRIKRASLPLNNLF